jgi:hypothetical protein
MSASARSYDNKNQSTRMKKTMITMSLLLLAVTFSHAQGVGLNCQYFPGLQVGFVGVKTTGNPKFSNYRFGAGMPLLMIDRVTSRWYTNLDFSALYYGATQTNRANDDRIKISKAEGALCSGRLGYMFGEGDQFRFGVNANLGMATSNLDSLVRPLKQRAYFNYGLGVLAYKKFGKFRLVGKLGYELYAKKDFITKGRGFYMEGTIAYSFYQKYGISVMPCFYSKKLEYAPVGGSVNSPASAKVRSFVLKFGITKFF